MILIRKEEWPAIREQGKIQFIIHYGILRIGVVFGLGLSLLQLIQENTFTLSHCKDYLNHEWFWILFRCLFFGVSFSLLEWRRNEESITK